MALKSGRMPRFSVWRLALRGLWVIPCIKDSSKGDPRDSAEHSDPQAHGIQPFDAFAAAFVAFVAFVAVGAPAFAIATLRHRHAGTQTSTQTST